MFFDLMVDLRVEIGKVLMSALGVLNRSFVARVSL